jgi:flavin reductase (DIM6/NTAB) family NADH-FMN oxidoreductase RutF
MHHAIEPKIMYFGTPVVLISTLNEDSSANLAPMSSAWWLGKSCMLGLGIHLQSIRELARVAREVRIFPLLELGSRKSRHLESVLAKLETQGFDFSVEQVNYEFQKGGNQMLKILATEGWK